MGKRIKDYLNYLATINYDELSDEQRNILRETLLTNIAFFQHERLIHLIVTVTFALLLMLDLIILNISSSLAYLMLFVLFLSLLIPYIKHYYLLENGVQKLYEYYDKLISKNE